MTATNEPRVMTGACLCGAVRFEVHGELAEATACHCVQCRRQSGHYWASANVQRSALTLHGEDQLRWFHSSAKVRRGFCGTCGAFLFWDPPAKDWTSIALGAFDAPTGVRLARHIFCAEQGDYYDIADGLPQHAR